MTNKNQRKCECKNSPLCPQISKNKCPDCGMDYAYSKEKQWCACGDEIDEEGANGQCWVCLDITPNQKNTVNSENPKISKSICDHDDDWPCSSDCWNRAIKIAPESQLSDSLKPWIQQIFANYYKQEKYFGKLLLHDFENNFNFTVNKRTARYLKRILKAKDHEAAEKVKVVVRVEKERVCEHNYLIKRLGHPIGRYDRMSTIYYCSKCLETKSD